MGNDLDYIRIPLKNGSEIIGEIFLIDEKSIFAVGILITKFKSSIFDEILVPIRLNIPGYLRYKKDPSKIYEGIHKYSAYPELDYYVLKIGAYEQVYIINPDKFKIWTKI